MPFRVHEAGQTREVEATLIGSFFNGLTELPAGVVMFTGTIPVEGEIRAADQLTIGLSDPRNGRALWHSYDTVTLPEVS